MTTTMQPSRRIGLVARHLLRTQLKGLELILLLYFGAVAVVGFLLHLTVGLTGSVWSGAAQLPHWFAVGMGVYLTAVYLPLYVAHGRTRHEVAVGSSVFAAAFAVWLGVAMAVGYAVEAGIYHLLGWNDLLLDPHPLGSVATAMTTIVESAAVFLVFIVVGAFAGAAFYRRAALGTLLVIPCLALLSLAAIFTAEASTPFDVPAPFHDPGLVLRLLAALGLAALTAAATWPIVRDLPLRPKAG